MTPASWERRVTDTERPYMICIECGHVYATAQDLVDAYNREVARLYAEHPEPAVADGRAPEFTIDDAHYIDFCQECIHDF